MARKSSAEQQAAIARLQEWIQDGDVIYTLIKSVSRSGMSLTIQLIGLNGNEPLYYGWNAGIATGRRYDRKREGLVIPGCGMDMGAALVDELAEALGIKLSHRWL